VAGSFADDGPLSGRAATWREHQPSGGGDLPRAATSLNNHSASLSELGRREDAPTAIDEVVTRILPVLERATYALPDRDDDCDHEPGAARRAFDRPRQGGGEGRVAQHVLAGGVDRLVR
jgi:hypothetical protein